ncbi:transposase [Amycolatopsis anabasis]|uniref:transposase n=1 Tax=Amycolatopsis anabasis TaxID=1840409 RepID=UPI00131B6D1F|nr:transposase [Amycolatopsis anabasis]
MADVLDQLNLTSLVTTIPGVSAVGVAAILAETGDLTRFDSPRAVVEHAGLCPREKQARRLLPKLGCTLSAQQPHCQLHRAEEPASPRSHSTNSSYIGAGPKAPILEQSPARVELAFPRLPAFACVRPDIGQLNVRRPGQQITAARLIWLARSSLSRTAGSWLE